MNKSELIELIAEKANLSKISAADALAAVIDAVTESLEKREPVVIAGFGTWDISDRSARQVRNPRTGEMIALKATTVPRFRAGKKLKEAVANKETEKV
ncbi:MAG: DNA-binding protein HU [Gammaproteobacteria bacterium RIFCSPHIGHO2_12_FULL_41_15]|nr:MAG: DNA-binding protein HU [Gammaproteobacteria bacterium RIFCSPHIGHO2_12_FULL_41_15]